MQFPLPGGSDPTVCAGCQGLLVRCMEFIDCNGQRFSTWVCAQIEELQVILAARYPAKPRKPTAPRKFGPDPVRGPAQGVLL